MRLTMSLAPVVDLAKIDMKACLAWMFKKENQEIVTHDECRTGARFLSGITSPLQTKAKMKTSEFYGKLEGCDWESVLKLVRSEAIKRGVKQAGVAGVKRKAEVDQSSPSKIKKKY
jgi:hypothetical protein